MKCDECANFKPKRVQTGWECRECPKRNPLSGACLLMNPEVHGLNGRSCCMGAKVHPAKWKPFYGKVVE